MFKRLALVAALATASAAAFAAPVTYKIDPNHTNVIAGWNHFGFANPTAYFGQVDGSITYDAAKPANSKVEVTIPMAGLDTHVAAFDEHLRSADFFDAEKYPEISFKSTSVKPTSRKNVYDVTGDLTMHGVTKTITLPVEFLGFAKDPRGNQRAGFTTHVTLNRKDYGIMWNRALDNGGTLLSDDVDITVNIEAAKSAAAVKEEVKKEKTE
jgi:polyisoprenoid-binding protein YceI